MAHLVPQAIKAEGLLPVFAAASAGGDSTDPGDRVLVAVRNGSAVPVTVTLAVPGQEYGQNLADIPIVVPAAAGGIPALVLIGPLESGLADPAIAPGTGQVTWTYSASATVTVAALRM